ncbi:AAA family ATPase [Lachnospiraceae bacterium HCP1S3_A8]|nr:ATP-binding protein [Lachnospiraceae bacterium]
MTAMLKKRLPVGIENFEKIRRDGFYYVDKTDLIKELLENWGEVNLFTRPRRFGKTLNMSMFQCFFEIGCDKSLFDGLRIAEESTLCETYMGKFPVISISLKGIDAADYETARNLMVKVVNEEARRFQFLTESSRLTDTDKMLFGQLLQKEMDDETLFCSLRELTELLRKHYEKQVIVLIDEYDVPLAKANELGYYDEMVRLIRGIFGSALKTNHNLYFAVLTGCLRVAKESIFTGVNNFNTFTITDVDFDEYFGFTDAEVKEMLEEYQLGSSYEDVREWYDGYRFGNVDVYCPWDVICYVNKRRTDPALQPQNYWLNTSGNEVVRHFIEALGDGVTKTEMERLIGGEIVQKEIHEEMTYHDLYADMGNVWSVLFMTGYLTQRGRADGNLYNLAIPNREIRNIFTEQIMKMFQEQAEQDGDTLGRFCDALEQGNAEEVERCFTGYMRKTVSIRDTFVRKATKENFYHGMLIGLLGFKEGWTVMSNREAGDGFSDIQILIDDAETGIVIEVKYAQNGDLEAECQKALTQMRALHYEDGMRNAGMQMVFKYGIACWKKTCKVVVESESLV